jgi:L-asparaginase / beta-aspartyl-peptidase
VSVTASWSGAGDGIAVLVHGGAGDVADERVPVHVAGCRRAADAAFALLAEGASALDAAERAVVVLEDDPVFNAGTGACLTRDGRLELDACVMDGATLRVGAVCALSPFEHPIAVARAVLDDGTHVLYAAAGADAFARHAGFEPALPESMITDAARDKLRHALASGKIVSWAGGTVGAVARDRHGHVAAATSTGGTVGKRPGRVGDTPLVGAGTFADDAGGAASATGQGEGIMRVLLSARAVDALARGESPDTAAATVIRELYERVGATGGIIVVDPRGRLGFARSTRTMTWAAAWEGGSAEGS